MALDPESQNLLNLMAAANRPAWISLTPEQARAVVQFHARTTGAFDRVTDLSLMGAYARERGWRDIAAALLPVDGAPGMEQA